MDSSVTAVSTAASASAPNRESNKTLGTEEFFKLLLSQLQNQDPLNPMQDREFISQMAQFQTLETVTKMNKNMELVAEKLDNVTGSLDLMQKESFWSQAFSLLGKEVITNEGAGVIEKVKILDGEPYLVSGNYNWSLDQVKSVAEPLNQSSGQTEEGGANGE